ncbi:glycosyltransferase family 2 protein [Tardiphaga sp. 709]|uniref:glycosyltransferase family 2 protein n=1 Tax=Tardiphaga sp. 709 TaxID=3076039 RepID=UPI0028E2AE0C|nr:glycosyltransferase family 2 protein [Tardiphaga sp. 709]WNV09155.1 glycosyltransferase family 2 protein [Tardiphaga sp. 709]
MNGTAEQIKRRLISISVPVLNEEGNIDQLILRLQGVARDNPAYDFEFVVTDNASTDETFAKLAEHAVAEARLRVFKFSRNFGFQRSILFNLLNTRGDAAVQVDADLQDPPELITQFLEKWERGFKVVYGIRRKRKENLALLWARKIHYRLLRMLSEVEVPVDAGDFRLIDRSVIEHLRSFEDRSPYLRGIIASIGYAQAGIVYDRAERTVGKSKFNFFKLLTLSIDGVCSQSTKPLQYITMFGFAVCGISILLMVAYLIDYIFTSGTDPRGFTTLVLLTLASIGLNAAFVGLLGEYIGRIFSTVRGGPVAIVSDRIDSFAIEHEENMEIRSK